MQQLKTVAAMNKNRKILYVTYVIFQFSLFRLTKIHMSQNIDTNKQTWICLHIYIYSMKISIVLHKYQIVINSNTFC